MPNYNYKCAGCSVIREFFLPISTEPSKPIECESCKGMMSRIIRLPSGITGLKVFAGDWYKKTYGHELGQDGDDSAANRRDFEQAVKEQNREK